MKQKSHIFSGRSDSEVFAVAEDIKFLFYFKILKSKETIQQLVLANLAKL